MTSVHNFALTANTHTLGSIMKLSLLTVIFISSMAFFGCAEAKSGMDLKTC